MLSVLLLLFPWCCPSDQCLATTTVMQPGQDRAQRITDTWQGYQSRVPEHTIQNLISVRMKLCPILAK